MNRILAITAGMLALSAVPATAATVEWRGAAVLTAVSGCGTDYAVGNSIPIRYRPSGLGTNGTGSKFAFHQTFYAQAFMISGRFPATLTTVSAGGTGAGSGSFATVAKFKMTSVTPSTPTLNATTPSVALVGEIQNFGDLSGCNVSFRASGALKP